MEPSAFLLFIWLSSYPSSGNMPLRILSLVCNLVLLLLYVIVCPLTWAGASMYVCALWLVCILALLP
jgi:hypothetical protein